MSAGGVVNVLDARRELRARADVENEPTAGHEGQGQQQVERDGSTGEISALHCERNGTTLRHDVSSALLEAVQRLYLGGYAEEDIQGTGGSGRMSAVLQTVSGMKPAPIGTAVGFAALTAFGMLAGVWIIRRFEAWALRHTGELIAFASGLLVSGALLHLIWRSVDLAGAGLSLPFTLASFLALYVVEAHFVPHVHARGEGPVEHGGESRAHLGPLVVTALGLHSVVDGVSVGAALRTGMLLGWVTLMLVFVHKLPVGIASMSALYHSGIPGRRAVWITGLLAMVTPVAVLISYLALRGVSPQALGLLLALAGGSFLYVGAADLLPEGQARGRAANTVVFILGIAAMAALRLL